MLFEMWVALSLAPKRKQASKLYSLIHAVV